MPRLWPYDDVNGAIGHYYNVYFKNSLKFYETGYAGLLGMNRANGHLVWQSASTGTANNTATMSNILDIFSMFGTTIQNNANGFGLDHDGSKNGAAVSFRSNANQGYVWFNTYVNSGLKYVRNGHGGRFNLDIQNGGFQFYTSPAGSQDGTVIETLQFSIDENGNCRAVGAVGHQHVGAATPTGGVSGDIKIGDDSIWINDTGTWKSFSSTSAPVLPTIAALRLAVTNAHNTIHVQAYAILGDNGGGIFDYDSTDTTSIDNGGTIIVAGTRRYKRRLTGPISVKMFGAKADGVTDDYNSIIAAISAASVKGGGDVLFPGSTLPYIHTTSLSIPSGIFLCGEGNVASILKYTGNSDGIIFANTIEAGGSFIQFWADTTAASAVHLSSDATHANLHNRFVQVVFRADGYTAAATLITGGAGTGGAGYVYFPSFLDCKWTSSVATVANAAIRTSTVNGAIGIQITSGRTTGFGTHFDFQNGSSQGARISNLVCDNNTTGFGNGLFIKLGPNVNENSFVSMRFETSGSDNVGSIDASATANTIETMTGNYISSLSGGGLGIGFNTTRGFFQIFSNDTNVDPAPKTFNQLLQDTIYERTNGSGTTFRALSGHAKIILDAGGPIFTSFPGSPENNVVAPLGSYCADTTNGEGYIKKTGTGNTGWKLITHS